MNNHIFHAVVRGSNHPPVIRAHGENYEKGEAVASTAEELAGKEELLKDQRAGSGVEMELKKTARRRKKKHRENLQ